LDARPSHHRLRDRGLRVGGDALRPTGRQEPCEARGRQAGGRAMILSAICALSATVAGCFLGLRAQMLKPFLPSWPDAPRCVRQATFALSAVLGGYVVAVVNGYPPSTGEAVLLVALAAYAFLLWLNLYRQARSSH